MAIQMSENFKLLSKEALDGRISYKSLSEMVSMQDSYLYDGCLATIEGDATKKIYQWWSSNAIDSTLGKWRELKFNEDIINDEIISTESTWSSEKIDEQIKLKDVVKDITIESIEELGSENIVYRVSGYQNIYPVGYEYGYKRDDCRNALNKYLGNLYIKKEDNNYIKITEVIITNVSGVGTNVQIKTEEGNIIDVIEYVSYGENQNPVTSLIDIYLKEFKTYAKDTLLAIINDENENDKNSTWSSYKIKEYVSSTSREIENKLLYSTEGNMGYIKIGEFLPHTDNGYMKHVSFKYSTLMYINSDGSLKSIPFQLTIQARGKDKTEEIVSFDGFLNEYDSSFFDIEVYSDCYIPKDETENAIRRYVVYLKTKKSYYILIQGALQYSENLGEIFGGFKPSIESPIISEIPLGEVNNGQKMELIDSLSSAIADKRVLCIKDISTSTTTEIDDTLTIEHAAADAKVTGDLIRGVIDNQAGVSNRLEGLEWTPGFHDSTGALISFVDFWHTVVPVTPGETLYFNWHFKQLTITFFNSANNFVTYGSYATTDSDVSIVIPDDPTIMYMSIPCRIGMCGGLIMSSERICNRGNVPEISSLYITSGNLTRLTADSEFYHPQNLLGYVSKNSESETGWRVIFTEKGNIDFGFGQGHIILARHRTNNWFFAISTGINSDGSTLTPSNAKLYIFGPNNGYIELKQGEIIPSTWTKRFYNSRIIKTDDSQVVTLRSKYLSDTVRFTYSQLAELTTGTAAEVSVSDIVPCSGCICLPQATTVYENTSIISFFSSEIVPAYSTIDISSGETNHWMNKKWYCYGTSMTDISMNGYAEKLANLAGLEMHNFGIGGGGIISSLSHGGNVKNRVKTLSDGKAEADLITVEVIPNDMSGTLGDPTNPQADTFVEALYDIIEYLQTNTNAQIVILIATRSVYNYQNTSEQYPPESSSITKWREWEKATIEVCERCGVQCWNGAGESSLGYYRMMKDNNKYVQDQIHLTNVGAYNLAQFYYNKLKHLPLFYTTY